MEAIANWFAQMGTNIALWFDGVKADFILNFIEANRWKFIVEGFGITVEVSIMAVAIGIALGMLVALMVMSKSRFLSTVGRWYVDIIRGTPSVTQLLIIYFVIFGSVRWPAPVIAAIAFGINSGAYVAEIVRAGIQSIDHGQTEAGRSLGLSQAQTMVKIVIPQALKNIFPALCNEFIILIKETAIVGYVGVMDLARAGDFIRSNTYSAFMPLIGTAVIYFIFIKILTKLFGLLEKKLRKSDVR